jgi:Taurine catabolism dioxygenase TauD, TfdA family
MGQAANIETTTFSVRPLAPNFGAEIVGLDLSRPLEPETVAAVRHEFDNRRLLLFRNQELSPEAHIAFSRNFGTLEIHVLNQYLAADHPELYVISNVGPDGKPKGVHPDKGTLKWHTDLSFMARPSYATILYAVEIPSQGGETEFADMLGGYEALPADLKRRIDGRTAEHDLNVSRARGRRPHDPGAARQGAARRSSDRAFASPDRAQGRVSRAALRADSGPERSRKRRTACRSAGLRDPGSVRLSPSLAPWRPDHVGQPSDPASRDELRHRP